MIFKQVFRVAFIALVWKQYRAVIVSTLLLLAFFFVVSSLHNDYLAAVGDDAKQISFIYKWCAYAAGLIAYFIFHAIRNRIKSKTAKRKEEFAESKKFDNNDDDPFAKIRARKTLRSRADFIAEDSKNK